MFRGVLHLEPFLRMHQQQQNNKNLVVSPLKIYFVNLSTKRFNNLRLLSIIIAEGHNSATIDSSAVNSSHYFLIHITFDDVWSPH